MDVLEEQPVAGLVYQRRKHYINLFIWPSSRNVSAGQKFLAQRGYNLFHLTGGGMDYWTVSDVNRADLQAFAELLRGQTPQPSSK